MSVDVQASPSPGQPPRLQLVFSLDYEISPWFGVGVEQAGFYHFSTDNDGFGGRSAASLGLATRRERADAVPRRDIADRNMCSEVRCISALDGSDDVVARVGDDERVRRQLEPVRALEERGRRRATVA